MLGRLLQKYLGWSESWRGCREWTSFSSTFRRIDDRKSWCKSGIARRCRMAAGISCRCFLPPFQLRTDLSGLLKDLWICARSCPTLFSGRLAGHRFWKLTFGVLTFELWARRFLMRACRCFRQSQLVGRLASSSHLQALWFLSVERLKPGFCVVFIFLYLLFLKSQNGNFQIASLNFPLPTWLYCSRLTCAQLPVKL